MIQFKSMTLISNINLIDSTNDEFVAILNATRWLNSQNPSEMLGDDSVGWWMLIFTGKSLPSTIEFELKSQLNKILPKIQIGKSSLYTASAISRTLKRANRLENESKVVARLIKTIEESTFLIDFNTNKTLESIPIDIIWILQAIYELGGFTKYKTPDSIYSFLNEVKYNNPVEVSMLWPILKIVRTPEKLSEIAKIILESRQEILSSAWLENYLDWQVSYVLKFLVDNKMTEEAQVIAIHLLRRQKDGQWDEETDENIESTSLVSLALFSYWKEKNRSNLLVNTDKMIDFCLNQCLNIALEAKEDLNEKWTILKKSSEKKNKGEMLEDFISFYISQDDSHFKIDENRARTKSEEIDIVLENLEADGFFKQIQSRLILVECKYTKIKTSAKEVRDFWTKIQSRKRFLCKIGFLISISGFTKDADIELFRLNSSEKEMIICGIDGKELEDSILKALPFSSLLEKSIIKTNKR